jgi:hypothetical protein
MKEFGIIVLTLLGCFVVMVLLNASGSGPAKSIAENCKEKFAYDTQGETRCEFMAFGTIALQQAQARDDADAWKIQQVIRESR